LTSAHPADTHAAVASELFALSEHDIVNLEKNQEQKIFGVLNRVLGAFAKIFSGVKKWKRIRHGSNDFVYIAMDCAFLPKVLLIEAGSGPLNAVTPTERYSPCIEKGHPLRTVQIATLTYYFTPETR
jgi:hypothetical protein